MKAVFLASTGRPAPKTSRLVIATLAVLLKCLIALAAFAAAQEPKPHAAWQAVVNLPPGAKLRIHARSRHIHCFFLSASESALTCSQAKTDAPIVIGRNDILTIQVGHRGRSALMGAGIGGGGLAIAAFAQTSNPGDTFFGPNFLRGTATAMGALAGGVIGGGIGALSDFSRSTVYSVR